MRFFDFLWICVDGSDCLSSQNILSSYSLHVSGTHWKCHQTKFPLNRWSIDQHVVTVCFPACCVWRSTRMTQDAAGLEIRRHLWLCHILMKWHFLVVSISFATILYSFAFCFRIILKCNLHPEILSHFRGLTEDCPVLFCIHFSLFPYISLSPCHRPAAPSSALYIKTPAIAESKCCASDIYKIKTSKW